MQGVKMGGVSHGVDVSGGGTVGLSWVCFDRQGLRWDDKGVDAERARVPNTCGTPHTETALLQAKGPEHCQAKGRQLAGS